MKTNPRTFDCNLDVNSQMIRQKDPEEPSALNGPATFGATFATRELEDAWLPTQTAPDTLVLAILHKILIQREDGAQLKEIKFDAWNEALN